MASFQAGKTILLLKATENIKSVFIMQFLDIERTGNMDYGTELKINPVLILPLFCCVDFGENFNLTVSVLRLKNNNNSLFCKVFHPRTSKQYSNTNELSFTLHL